MRRPFGVLAAVAVLAAGCRSASPPVVLTADQLAAAAAELGRPLPGDLVALYRLRVRASSGLRLSVVARGGSGRLSVSEPFGSLASVTVWSPGLPPQLWDLRAGCRLERADLAAVLGLPALPLEEAMRLLAGRLPALEGDRVVALPEGRLRVEGAGWACVVTLAPGPWRVVRVEEADAPRKGWFVELGEAEGSIPRTVHIANRDGRWAELELVRLEWQTIGEPPPLPELPPCSARGGRG